MYVTYLISGMFNKIVVLLSIIFVSHYLSENQFGIYSLILSNGLLLQIFCGSWLSASVGRAFAIYPPDFFSVLINGSILSAMIIGVIGICAIVVYALLPNPPLSTGIVIAVIGFAISLIWYELIQAAQNGMGQARHYALNAIARNVGMFLPAMIVVATTGLAVHVIAGQIAVTVVVTLIALRLIVTRYAISIKPTKQAMDWKIFRSVGVNGTLLFGYYIIVSALFKNVIAYRFGVDIAGQLGLALDLLFAPLALLSNAASLSQMPILYRLAREREGDRGVPWRRSVMRYVTAHLSVAAPYVIVATFLFPLAARLVLPSNFQSLSFINTLWLATLSAALVIMYSLLTILTIFGRPWKMSMVCLFAVSAHLFAVTIAGDTAFAIIEYAAFAQISAILIAVAMLASITIIYDKNVDLK